VSRRASLAAHEWPNNPQCLPPRGHKSPPPSKKVRTQARAFATLRARLLFEAAQVKVPPAGSGSRPDRPAFDREPSRSWRPGNQMGGIHRQRNGGVNEAHGARPRRTLGRQRGHRTSWPPRFQTGHDFCGDGKAVRRARTGPQAGRQRSRARGGPAVCGCGRARLHVTRRRERRALEGAPSGAGGPSQGRVFLRELR
jgi:hypothetical protein